MSQKLGFKFQSSAEALNSLSIATSAIDHYTEVGRQADLPTNFKTIEESSAVAQGEILMLYSGSVNGIIVQQM